MKATSRRDPVGARPRDRTKLPAAALYRGTVRHRRVQPAAREFAPELWLAYVDVDALPGALDPLPLWSARRAAPVRFRRCDFLDGGTRPLGVAVRDLVADRLGYRPAGPVFLLAQLRTFGFGFNPLAVYYCWDREGEALDAVVLEVTNTPWGERSWYVFDARAGLTQGRAPKVMHVSPFLPMDAHYRVTWTPPAADLKLTVAVDHADGLLLHADLAMARVALDRRRALGFVFRHPLEPRRGFLRIYCEALRLLVARVPVHRHPGPRHSLRDAA
jgi:DUF1365 family protein